MKKLSITLRGNTTEAIYNCLEQVLIELRTAIKNDDEINNGGISFAGVDGTKELIDEEEVKERFEEDAGYELSDNQVQFCIDAEKDDLNIDFSYSGRGMSGRSCPSVTIEEYDDDFKTEADVEVDSMGRGKVIYARY